jgi:hypothetical protein
MARMIKKNGSLDAATVTRQGRFYDHPEIVNALKATDTYGRASEGRSPCPSHQASWGPRVIMCLRAGTGFLSKPPD